MQIIEAVILFTALTSIIIVSFSQAASFAIYQATVFETKYAVGSMIQLGHGAQSIADGSEGTADVQFTYRYGVLTYLNGTAVTVELITQSQTTTVYTNSQYGRFEYITPYTVYGSAPVQDKGSELTPFVTKPEDAVAVYHYSADGRTHAVVQPRPVVTWHMNSDGTIDIRIFIVELIREQPLLTRQGPVRLLYNATSYGETLALTAPFTIRVTFAGENRETTVGSAGATVRVYLKIVRVMS